MLCWLPTTSLHQDALQVAYHDCICGSHLLNIVMLVSTLPQVVGIHGFGFPGLILFESSDPFDFHSFDFDPEEKPTSENIKEWATWVKTSDNTLLIWESVPVESVSNQFKGAVHLALDPLEQPLPNSDYNYLNQAEANILMLETIAQTVQTKSNPSEK